MNLWFNSSTPRLLLLGLIRHIFKEHSSIFVDLIFPYTFSQLTHICRPFIYFFISLENCWHLLSKKVICNKFLHDTLRDGERLIEKWRFNSLIKSYLSVKTASMLIDRLPAMDFFISYKGEMKCCCKQCNVYTFF